MAEKDPQNRTWLQALWQLRQGQTTTEVAKLVGKHPRTIQDWIAWYRQGGLEEVLRHCHGEHGGKSSRLTAEQMDELEAVASAGQVRWDWTANMNSESIAPVVKQWAEQQVAVVVWDHARGHCGSAYAEVLVKLIEQPPYSHDLNPAERVFDYLSGRIEEQVYSTIAAKKTAIEGELRALASAPDKIRSLPGWDWICQSVAGLWNQTRSFNRHVELDKES